MKDIPISIATASELEREVDFGGEIEEGGFFARVNDRPVAIHIPSVFEEFNQSPQSKVYEQFEPWLIPHSIALIRRSGFAEATSVGIEVEFLNEDRTCSIISLCPSPQWKRVGGGRVTFSAAGAFSMAPNGELHYLEGEPDAAKEMIIQGIKFGLSSSGQVWLDLCASVATPIVQAVGAGSQRCEWRFHRDESPLFGRDIAAWSVVVLSRHQKRIRMRMRYYFITRTLFYPTRRESEWVEVDCDLIKPNRQESGNEPVV